VFDVKNLTMKISIEIDTERDNKELVKRVLNAFTEDKIRPTEIKAVKEGLGAKREIFVSKPTKVEKTTPKEDIKRLSKEIKSEFKKLKAKYKEKIKYPISFKKKVIEYYDLAYGLDKKTQKNIIAKKFGLRQSTYCSWLNGERLKGRFPVVSIKKPLSKKTPSKYNKKLGSFSTIEARNREITDHLNSNPYDSWEEVGEKFGLSRTLIYLVAKKSKKVRIMKRTWDKMIDKRNLPYKKPEPKKAEPIKKKTLANIILKFDHSKVSQEDTILGLNECISKGVLSYRDDANRFGFDRNGLPTNDWFDFITEVAQKVSSMLGIDVTLSQTMTDITFKR
jgi:hypothetical protein